MSVNRLPTGVSVVQAKKDAKRLVNNSKIPLSQAQNDVALKHGRADWPTLMNQLKTQSSLLVMLKQSFLNKVSLVFPENKSLNIVVGETGSGKSLLLLEFAAQWLQKGFPVVYLGADVSKVEVIPEFQHGAIATRNLILKYPDLFTAIPFEPFTKDFVLDDLMLNGAIFIAEELPLMMGREMMGINVEQVQKLLNSSMHSFLGFQSLGDAHSITSELKNITDDNTRLIILKSSIPDLYENTPFEYHRTLMTEEVEQLIKKNNKFVEFLYVDHESYQKLRFRLADHRAL